VEDLIQCPIDFNPKVKLEAHIEIIQAEKKNYVKPWYGN
jgi:hypothetical protein